jgi:hypothetical protein
MDRDSSTTSLEEVETTVSVEQQSDSLGRDWECGKCGGSGDWKELAPYRTAKHYGYYTMCEGCVIDEIPDPQVWRPRLIDPDFTYFYGCASGSSKKALVKMEEENIMLNYQTRNNTDPAAHPDSPDDHNPTVFTDSGGSPQSFDGDYKDVSVNEFLDYVRDVSDYWTLWDFPCEQELLDRFGRTVEEHQRRTTDRHVELLNLAEDHHIEAQPVSVIQGQTISQYLEHLDQLRDEGALTNYVAIGSVCARDRTGEIQRIIRRLREAIPARCKLHAYGVKVPALEDKEVMSALDSADSCAYDYGLRMKSVDPSEDTRYIWENCTHEYLVFRKKIGQLIQNYMDDSHTTLESFDNDALGERRRVAEQPEQETDSESATSQIGIGEFGPADD